MASGSLAVGLNSLIRWPLPAHFINTGAEIVIRSVDGAKAVAHCKSIFVALTYASPMFRHRAINTPLMALTTPNENIFSGRISECHAAEELSWRVFSIQGRFSPLCCF